jgi:hypothetical protein
VTLYIAADDYSLEAAISNSLPSASGRRFAADSQMGPQRSGFSTTLALPAGRCFARSIATGGCGLAPVDVARVVKKLAERAGLDAAKHAGHSLRAGHATSAGKLGL